LFPRLHIVTDSLDVVRAAVGHGPVAIQVRVKTSDRLAYELTVAALALCRAAGAICLVDDRVGVALAAGADGVHVGAEDLPVDAVRRLLGPSAIVGATCRNPAAARAAVAAGAGYLGVGPAFATSSKAGLPPPIGAAGIGAVVDAVPGTPVIAIGGIIAARVAEAGGTLALLAALASRDELPRGHPSPPGGAVAGGVGSGGGW
jgi:thiamine-phosphate pyrophosphorylase